MAETSQSNETQIRQRVEQLVELSLVESKCLPVDREFIVRYQQWLPTDVDDQLIFLAYVLNRYGHNFSYYLLRCAPELWRAFGLNTWYHLLWKLENDEAQAAYFEFTAKYLGFHFWESIVERHPEVRRFVEGFKQSEMDREDHQLGIIAETHWFEAHRSRLLQESRHQGTTEWVFVQETFHLLKWKNIHW